MDFSEKQATEIAHHGHAVLTNFRKIAQAPRKILQSPDYPGAMIIQLLRELGDFTRSTTKGETD